MIAKPPERAVEKYREKVDSYTSLREYFANAVAEAGDDPFIIDGEADEVYSYERVDRETNAIANQLLELGLEKGDRISMFLPNRVEFYLVFLAAQKVGITPALINPELKGPSLTHTLDITDAKLVLTTPTLREKFDEHVSEPYPNDPLLVTGEGETVKGSGTTVSSLVAAGDESPPPDQELTEDHPSVIPFSSGTTGLPKAIVQPQMMFVLTGELFADITPMEEGGGYHNCLPLYHQGGIWPLYIAMACRGYTTLFETFRTSQFWDRVFRYECNGANLVSEMGNWLYNQPEAADDADNPLTWLLIWGGPKQARKEFEERFGIEYLTLYGMTELGPISWSQSPTKTGDPPLSDGRPFTHEIKIVDDHDRTLPVGESGEIVTRPCLDNVMFKEYASMPAKTAAQLRNCWCHTGDVGRLDEDGNLYFEGRKDDYIRRKGENIAHAEIETVVNEHEAVMESAVIGIPDEAVGEEVKVHAVPADESVTLEDVVRYCEETLPRFQIPRYVEILDELPRTPTERIQKFKLEDRGEDGLTETTWDRENEEYVDGS